MTVVAQIPPLGSGPGLIGYECPKCVYVTSVLWRPKAASEVAPVPPASDPFCHPRSICHRGRSRSAWGSVRNWLPRKPLAANDKGA